MKRITAAALTLATLAGLAGLSTACNVELSPYAAKVGSHVISTSELDNALSRESHDSGLACWIGHNIGKVPAGAGTDTYNSTFAAFVLTNLVSFEVLHSVVAARHLSEPASALAIARAQVVEAFDSELSQASCAGTGTTALSALGSSLSSSFTEGQLDEDALVAQANHFSLSATSMAAYETSHPSATKQSCISGIFVKSTSLADKVERLLKRGSTFTSLVTKYSESTSTAADGGALGCYTSSQLAEIDPALETALQAAAVGAITKPVRYAPSGEAPAYIVILVTSRPFEPAIDFLDQVFQTDTAAFTTAIERDDRSAHIVVDPEYGSWRTDRVQPPRGATSEDLLNEQATQGASAPSATSSLGSGG